MRRGAGVLLPVTSLPSPYGIGTFGRAAYAFVDFLRDAGQRYWQVLPLGPTSYGDSPYQSFSAFAGNPYFIDLDLLQNIQDNCSKAMGLAFITVDYKGIPITKYSGFTSHCMLGRQAKGFAEMCEQCDAHGGLHAAITGQPYIYRCHADLVDFAVPLIVNGSYMGAVLGGQVRLQEESERELEHILPQRPNWKRDKEWGGGLPEAGGRHL